MIENNQPGNEPAADQEEGIYYPDAIRLPGVRMRVRDTYQHGFPIGAIIHSTDGRPNDGKQSAEYAASEGKYAYFVIGRTGNVYQCFSLSFWGEHAGPTRHPSLGNRLSRKLVGIEVVSAGKLKKIDDNRYRPWYNDKPTRPTPKLDDDFTADAVRHREAVGSPAAFGYQTAGYYHKFTAAQEAALTGLLKWLQHQRPEVFKFENVLGHDESAVEDNGKYGRKSDPGACLSVTMKEFRDRLLTNADE
jgi:N-acetyl-anhydromuramyl-L-alanine amidase AmpD